MTTKQIFHIRKQLVKRGGNQFYRDKSIRKTETLCGEPVTINDIQFKGKIDRSWLAKHFPEFEPCDKCLGLKNKTEVFNSPFVKPQSD